MNLDPDILRKVLLNENASQSMMIVQQKAGLEQFSIENEQLKQEIIKITQQRDGYQARATELVTVRDTLQERLTEYEPVEDGIVVDAEVVDETETPKPDEVAR